MQLKYLTGYPDDLLRQVHKLIADNKLANVLLKRYGATHDIRTDKALYQYVTALKNDFIRNGAPISKVVFDGKIHVVRHALGTHTAISRVHGNKLKAKREISVSSLFKHVPIEFLKMIVVHELAHLKEKEHDKAFYKLFTYMEPQYHQDELDLRLYLTYLDLSTRDSPVSRILGAIHLAIARVLHLDRCTVRGCLRTGRSPERASRPQVSNKLNRYCTYLT